MAENDCRRSAFVALLGHNTACPHVEILLSPSHPLLSATRAPTLFMRFFEEAQKNRRSRAIRQIAHKITLLLGAMGLSVSTIGCGPAVVNLGARGGSVGDSGLGGSAAISGSAGASGGGAGMGQVGIGTAGSSLAAVGGAGSGPAGAGGAGAAAPQGGGAAASVGEPSTGCGMQPPAASDTSITVNGLTARYIVDAASYDRNRPYPLVMSFRGAKVTLASFRRNLDLPAVVGEDGIVVNVDCANGATMWDVQRDRQVFEALLAKLEASYCIDRRRVFVVGHETGAIFANVLACAHAEALRGLGSISGVEPQGTCAGPLAVWISQGNADMTRTLGRANRDSWIKQNECDANRFVPVDPSPCVEYQGCKMGSPVRYCEYAGNQDVPSFAAAAVWNFLRVM